MKRKSGKLRRCKQTSGSLHFFSAPRPTLAGPRAWAGCLVCCVKRAPLGRCNPSCAHRSLLGFWSMLVTSSAAQRTIPFFFKKKTTASDSEFHVRRSKTSVFFPAPEDGRSTHPCVVFPYIESIISFFFLFKIIFNLPCSHS